MPSSAAASQSPGVHPTPRADQARNLLKLDPRYPGRVASRENRRLEYKETFNWGSRAKYAKTMAAFANTAGGFIVFGVRDSPRDVVGMRTDRFETLEPAQVTEYLNSVLAPELAWEPFSIELAGFELGVIAVDEATAKPVVCTRDAGQELREAEIYYRYRGRSQRIRYPELQRMIADGQRRERMALLGHLRRIVRAGPENVGVLDLVNGELAGHRGSLLISQELLREIQFIREGRFAEADDAGTPTLRVLGDVEVVPSGSLLPVRTVRTPMAIGQRELMLGFLRQERPREPIEYLKQACRENSANMPVYHYARAAGLGLDQLRALVVGETPNRKGLLRRIDGAMIDAIGSVDSDTAASTDRQDILYALQAGSADGLRQFGDARLFEAISHYVPAEVPSALMSLLADLILNEFGTLGSPAQTHARKAVAHLDEVLNRDACLRDAPVS